MLKSTAVERPKQTIIQTAAQAYLLTHRHQLSAFIDPTKLAARLADLCEDQDERLRDEDPTSPIPLLWIALAECAGLAVDIPTGRIVDGPKEHILSLEKFPVNKKPASPRLPEENIL